MFQARSAPNAETTRLELQRFIKQAFDTLQAAHQETEQLPGQKQGIYSIYTQPKILFLPTAGPHDRRSRGKVNEGLIWDHDVPADLRDQLRTSPKVLEFLRGMPLPTLKPKEAAKTFHWETKTERNRFGFKSIKETLSVEAAALEPKGQEQLTFIPLNEIIQHRP